jgi:thymidylate synthase
MEIINAKSIGQAWLKSCEVILKKGIRMKDNNEKLKEVMHLVLIIESPGEKDEIVEKYGDKKSIEWMLSNFLEQKSVPELGNSLSYGTRLFNYDGKNQVQWVIEKLIKKPESKSATISMLMPNRDEKYIPCIGLLDFKIRNEKLILTVLCRSLDFGTKAYANMIALTKIQNMIAKELKIQRGKMVLYVISAHIYRKDFGRIKSILEESR